LVWRTGRWNVDFYRQSLVFNAYSVMNTIDRSAFPKVKIDINIQLVIR